MMKNGWHDTINNVVFYYKKPFNVAVIIEKISKYNNVLSEQANILIRASMERHLNQE